MVFQYRLRIPIYRKQALSESMVKEAVFLLVKLMKDGEMDLYLNQENFFKYTDLRGH